MNSVEVHCPRCGHRFNPQSASHGSAVHRPFRPIYAIATVLLSIVCVLLIGEAVARIAGPPTNSFPYYEPAPDGLYWQHKRNAKFEALFPTALVRFDADRSLPIYKQEKGEYVLNSRGFRDPERSAADLTSHTVVLCLGDSITFGSFVREPDSYVRQTEALLNRGSKRWLFINAGVGGYNLDQYAEMLRRWRPVFNPKIVIVGLYMNDQIPWPRYQRWLTWLDQHSALYAKLGGWSVWSQLPWRRVSPGSALIDHLNATIGWNSARAVMRYAAQTGDLGSLVHSLEPLNSSALWPRALSTLRGMKSECQAAGAQLVVVVIPDQLQVSFGYDYPEPQKTIDAALAKAAIPYVDMEPIFRQQIQAGKPIYFSLFDRAHFNADGHRLVAQALAQKLQKVWPKK
jgi:lysophospholipase L1-like esterase